MRYSQLKEAIEKSSMPEIVKSLTGQSVKKIPCPFHSDSGTSMTVHHDHVTCRECGVFNPVQYVMQVKECGEKEAIDFCLKTSATGYIDVARELMRAIMRESGKRFNFPEEYCGYIKKGILPLANELKGTILESDPLEEGVVFFLDDGFCDSKGNVVGNPGFTKIKGKGDYIKICRTYKKAVLCTTDSACEVDADTLKKYGRPVLALDEDQAQYLSSRHIDSGYKKDGKICWLRDGAKKIASGGIQYHDRGDLYTYMRCLPGINRWKLDDMDAWMYMTGEDADIKVRDFLSDEGKNVLNAMRIPQELHFFNTAMGARVSTKTPSRARKMAETKDASLLKVRCAREPGKEVHLRVPKPYAFYYRFPAKHMRLAGDKAIIFLGNGIRAEADIGDVYRRKGLVYVLTTGNVKFLQMGESGSIELPMKQPFKPKPYREKSKMKMTLNLPLDAVRQEGNRYRVEVPGGYISIREKYMEKKGDHFVLSLLNRFEPPLHGPDGHIVMVTEEKKGSKKKKKTPATVSYRVLRKTYPQYAERIHDFGKEND